MASLQRDDQQDTQRSVGIDRPIELLESRREAKAEARVAGELRSQKVRFFTEKFLARSLSGVIYVIAVLGCIYAGVLPTTILVAAMSWLCCSEFFRMARMAGRMPNEFIGLAIALIGPFLTYFVETRIAGWMFAILLVACVVWYVITPRANLADVAITAFGPFYTAFPFISLILIRMSHTGIDGFWLTLAVMATMWVNDTFAYLIGSRIGIHQLAPKISPHKSWEGFWGGMIGSALVWLLASISGLVAIPLMFALVLGVLVGLAGVIGDLFESRIKRGVGVKDAGTLMPGHGGLLDRSDSMLFGCLVAYFVLLAGGFV